jgi:hypothetical protein
MFFHGGRTIGRREGTCVMSEPAVEAYGLTGRENLRLMRRLLVVFASLAARTYARMGR